MLFAYVLLSLSKQKLRARMKATAVHRLHENEIWNPAAAVPVLPACLAGALFLAKWPWSAVCQVQTEKCSLQCFPIKFRYWLKTLLFDTVVQIPGNVDSCVICQFNTVVPVISSLHILALGKMRSGFYMGGMLLQFQEKRVVILVLLDCTSIPRSKKGVDSSIPSCVEQWVNTSNYFLNQSPRVSQICIKPGLSQGTSKTSDFTKMFRCYHQCSG